MLDTSCPRSCPPGLCLGPGWLGWPRRAHGAVGTTVACASLTEWVKVSSRVQTEKQMGWQGRRVPEPLGYQARSLQRWSC